MLSKIDNVNAHYAQLYRIWQTTRRDMQAMEDQYKDLKQQLDTVTDRANIEKYLVDNENSMLEDAFEKVYISRYHEFLISTIGKSPQNDA